MPVQFNLQRIRAGFKALANGEDRSLRTTCYHLSLTGPDADQSATYTIHLVRHEEGTYKATCPELPEVLAFHTSESGALEAARAAIKEAQAESRH